MVLEEDDSREVIKKPWIWASTFDTANVYSYGASEGNRRSSMVNDFAPWDEIVVATKLYSKNETAT